MTISEVYPHLKTVALAYVLKLNRAKDFKFAKIIFTPNFFRISFVIGSLLQISLLRIKNKNSICFIFNLNNIIISLLNVSIIFGII